MRQQRLERILSWTQIFGKVIQPFCNVMSVSISSWLCFIIFTRCTTIIFDLDLLRTCSNELKKCSLNGLLVYTTVLYTATDILYRLCKASTVLFKTLQFTRDLLNKLQFPRIFLILAVHYLFVSAWYLGQAEFKDSQTKTLTLCGDSYMSMTLKTFKDSQLESVCIKSLYNSIFWTLLFIDLSICSIVPCTLIKLLLFYYSTSSVTRYSS